MGGKNGVNAFFVSITLYFAVGALYGEPCVRGTEQWCAAIELL